MVTRIIHKLVYLNKFPYDISSDFMACEILLPGQFSHENGSIFTDPWMLAIFIR